MDFLTILLVSIGLSMDTFAVSLGIGTTQRCNSKRSAVRLIWHLSFFQAGMTFIGWAAGETIQRYLSGLDHWIIFALLLFVGGRMLLEGFDKKEDKEANGNDPTRGSTLVLLSLATSLDASAVGLSMAMMNLNILFSVIAIGIVTAAFAATGLFAGNLLGTRFGKRMEILGGIILIGIGIRVVIEHMFG